LDFIPVLTDEEQAERRELCRGLGRRNRVGGIET
jgi:hypothetical protein